MSGELYKNKKMIRMRMQQRDSALNNNCLCGNAVIFYENYVIFYYCHVKFKVAHKPHRL